MSENPLTLERIRAMPKDDGPPLKFVAIWGLFAVVMVYAHTQIAVQGVQIAMPFQIEDAEQPAMMATLD